MLKTTTLGYYSTVFDVLFCIAYHLENKHIVTAQLNLNLSCCHSPTQPQLELELDLIMGRKPPHHPPHHPPTQELLRHFQAT